MVKHDTLEWFYGDKFENYSWVEGNHCKNMQTHSSIHWKDFRGRKLTAAIWNSLAWEGPRKGKNEKSTHWEDPTGGKSWLWRPGLRMAMTLFELEMLRCTNVTQTNTCIINYFVLIWNHAQLQCKITRVSLSCKIQKPFSAPGTNQVNLRCGRPPHAKRGEYNMTIWKNKLQLERPTESTGTAWARAP